VAAKKCTKSSGNAAFLFLKHHCSSIHANVARRHGDAQTVALCAVKHILSSTNIVKLDYDL
jgi:hypothetical protein